jgi:hypothetical protein
MPYGVFADAVLIIHLCFVFFVVLGGLLALRWRWVVWLHLPAAAWGAVVEIAGWMCPLTPLEVAFRRAAGQAVYETSFVERYLLPLVYPSALTRETQTVLGALLVAVNIAVYGAVWRRRIGRKP